MDLFGRKATRQVSELQSVVTSMQQQMQILAANRTVYPNAQLLTSVQKYITIDDIYSIVNLIATTAAMIPSYAYAIKKGAKVNKSHEVNIVRKRLMQYKTLEDLPDTDEFQKFVSDPYYGFSRFEGDIAKNKCMLIHGEYFLYKQRPEFGAQKNKVVKLHLLYPQHVQIRVNDRFPYKIIGYDYAVDGNVIISNIPVEDVIHVKYFNPKLSITGDELRGLSPLQVLANRVSRIDSNMAVSQAQMNNGGVPGIVFMKGMDNTQAGNASEAHKRNFYNYLTKKENKGAPYFAGNEMDYLQMGLPLADLLITELERVDFKKLCNAYGVSDVLFNNDKASTDNNTEWASKRLYTNTVLPLLYFERDSINKHLVPDFGPQYFYDFDLTNIPELQSDMKRMAEIFSTLPIMIPNDILEAFGYGEQSDPSMQQVFIKSGYMPLSDLTSDELPLTNDY